MNKIPFHIRIEEAFENPVLQEALDNNADRRNNVRRQALGALPDHQKMRQLAHGVRADVIANLDQYLKRFTNRVQENGIQVHQAANAKEAQEIVLQIAQQHEARLVAKAKTMVSEEIHLNAALEKAGLKVVETDLGEYIVQLRGEPPAHIITPAVHLRRQEVGQTFHEKLGLPLTDNVLLLTAAARERLRQVFLEADIGITGVNFGVVDTGTLCMITNEGNGRMVTTLPPVHIALMGIERLVPTLDDLALMLALLPRSATGQKSTVYTNLIDSPRRPGDVDGAQERHLVLVDNGRRALAATALAEILYCIRCGACLNACPVFREIGGHAYVSKQGKVSSYPGPIGSVLSPALFGSSEFGHLARASSLCGACKEACPVDIDLPKLLLRVRAGKMGVPHPQDHKVEKPSIGNAPKLMKWGLRLYTRVATNPHLFNLAIRTAAIASRIISPKRTWIKLPAFTGWGYRKDFPRPAVRPFRDRWTTRTRPEMPLSDHEQHFRVYERPDHSDRTEEALLPDFEIDKQGLWLLFKEEIEKIGGKASSCSENELPDKILELLQKFNAKEILSWSDENLPSQLFSRLVEYGIRPISSPDPFLSIGLTGALAGVAETGSIVVTSGVGRPLTASLMPEVHIAILYLDKLYLSLPDALAQVIPGHSTAVVITGPSRTADIEMTLTIGVHGPGEVYVICVDSGSG
jgi:L-lactate dehydrogenase complex protein LldF